MCVALELPPPIHCLRLPRSPSKMTKEDVVNLTKEISPTHFGLCIKACELFHSTPTFEETSNLNLTSCSPVFFSKDCLVRAETLSAKWKEFCLQTNFCEQTNYETNHTAWLSVLLQSFLFDGDETNQGIVMHRTTVTRAGHKDEAGYIFFLPSISCD